MSFGGGKKATKGGKVWEENSPGVDVEYIGQVEVPGARREGGGGSWEYGSRFKHECLKCNRFGHFERECRENKRHKERHLAKNYHCSGKGHIIVDCPTSLTEPDRARNRDELDLKMSRRREIEVE